MIRAAKHNNMVKWNADDNGIRGIPMPAKNDINDC